MDVKDSFVYVANYSGKVYVREWCRAMDNLPADSVSIDKEHATMLIVHGLGDHCQRYDQFAQDLLTKVPKLERCLAFDLPGHGETQRANQHVRGHYDVDDVNKIIDHLILGRTILYGHSLGGLLAVNYVLSPKSRHLEGLVLEAPGLGMAIPPPRVKECVGRLASYVLPRMTIDNGLDLTGLCRDQSQVDAWLADPRTHRRVALGSARQSLDLQQHISKLGGIIMPCAVLLIHGDADRLTSCSASQRFVERQLAPEGRGDVQLHIIDGGYHCLHREPAERERLLALLSTWLLAHMSQK